MQPPLQPCATATPGRTGPRGETRTHADAKRRIARALAARGLTVRIEAPVRGMAENRRADILVTSPAGDRVAVEIQHSPIEPAELLQRTRDYRNLKIGVVWIPTLDLATLTLRRLGSGRLHRVDRFVIPAWHEWIEAQQGALWYWADGALWRGWTEPLPVRETRAYRHYRDEDLPTAKRLRTLTLEGPFDPQAIRIQPRGPAPGPDVRFNLEPGASATLVANGERRPPANPALQPVPAWLAPRPARPMPHRHAA